MKIHVFLTSVLAFLAALLPARAAVIQFTGNSIGSALTLTTSGSYGSTTLTPTIATSFLISIDDAVPTLTYNQIAFTIPGFTVTNSASFTSGLGQSTLVTQAVTFDPFSILITSTQALALTATTGGNYSIPTPLIALSSLALWGHYVLTGPTQTHIGNFGTASLSGVGTGNGFRWTTFNSNGFPATSQLVAPFSGLASQRPHWGIFGNVIDDTVDGVHITTDLGTATLNGSPLGTINLTAVPTPEPTSCGLLGLGAVLLAARRRR